MMIDLLRNDFPTAYKSSINPGKVDSYEHKGKFVLFDKKACDECLKVHGVNNVSCVNKGKFEIACFDCDDKNVITIEYENFLYQYRKCKAGQGLKCDYIHYAENHDKIVLNELTCSKDIYVDPYESEGKPREGKRIHAVNQINHTIEVLNNVQSIKTYIDSFKEKVGLFSYRLTSLSDNGKTKNLGQQSMQKFLNSVKTVSNIQTQHSLNSGFLFEQRIFPEVFKF